MDLELQHSTMEVIDSSGSEIEINIFDDLAVNVFFRCASISCFQVVSQSVSQ